MMANIPSEWEAMRRCQRRFLGDPYLKDPRLLLTLAALWRLDVEARRRRRVLRVVILAWLLIGTLVGCWIVHHAAKS